MYVRSCNGDAVPLEDNECFPYPYIPNFEEHFEEVVYRKGEIDAVSVRKSDVDLLLPDIFINDTIIDFYITYLKNEIPHERRQNFHFFSSFFFRKLADLDKNPSSVFDGKAAFQRVRRWTRKVNIFEKDFIFIPVNYNLHWSLIILCHLGEVVNFNDENVNEALRVPCILHMDSIRGSHAGLKDLLQSYLLEEWKERQNETSEDVVSKFLNLRFISLELPQQENYTDCGLFLLHYAELFIDEAPPNFSPFRINEFDHFLKPNWFVPAEASLKRVYIQRLIYELLKSLSHKCASPPRNYLSHSPAVQEHKEDNHDIEFVSEKKIVEKLWNGNSYYSEAVHETEMGLLDMTISRPSHCIDSSGLGMTELLEQQGQHHVEGASLLKLGFSTSTIREEEDNGHLAYSNLGQTGLQEVDEGGESLIACSSGDLDQGFQWNLDLSDQGDPEETSSFSDLRSCDDSHSSEQTKILECNRETQSVDSCQNETMDQSKETAESQEGYASAASDMMGTPAEDSQKLAEMYGSSDLEEVPFRSNLEDTVELSQEKPSNIEYDRTISLSREVENDEAIGAEETLIVEDSPPDQLRPAKRLRVSPPPGHGSEVEGNEHQANSNLAHIGIQSVGQEAESHVCSSGDFAQSDQADHGETSLSCYDSTEELRILEHKQEIESVISCQNKNMLQSKKITESQEDYASASSDMMETPAEDSQELAEKYGSPDQEEHLFISNLEEVLEESQEELANTEYDGTDSLSGNDQTLVVEKSETEDDEVFGGNDDT